MNLTLCVKPGSCNFKNLLYELYYDLLNNVFVYILFFDSSKISKGSKNQCNSGPNGLGNYSVFFRLSLWTFYDKKGRRQFLKAGK